MSGQRLLGLSKRQSVPPLLGFVANKPVAKDMEDVDVDAPPLSSSDESDNDGLSTRGIIRTTQFPNSRQGKSPSGRDSKNTGANGKAIAPAERFKRTRASTQSASGRVSGSSPQAADKQPEAIDSDNAMSSPASKKPKRSLSGNGELGSHHEPDIFAKKTVASKRYGKSKTFGSKAGRGASTARASKPRQKDSTPEAEDSRRFELRLPSSPSKASEDAPSPARKFKAIPGFSSPAKPSPTRKKRLKMPNDDSLVLSGEHETPEESQRPVFTIPDELPDSFIGGENDDIGFALSPTAGTPNASNPLRDSTSPLTDLESINPTPVCPLCKKEVDQAQLDDFTASHPRMTVANMRRFCEQHKRQSARDTWVHKGYPDIDWQRLDERIALHYPLLRRILEGGGGGGGAPPSHYGDLFRDAVRAGRNRTLLRSDANLTPGYYGMRGLRAMTENLISEFSALLRKRSLEDRLVSARGHTAYLQAVLVPELAVRLIMEDMGVGEEEARAVLTESSDVGELLNDEIADVVLEDDDDDDDDDESS
ncbi:RTC4-like domain-containing protein [Parachaetomium inaequale]|uniref:Restriction of telomere capping protein 4 n=1 Tax=Parachaetomium inaequale TaxID=2588326 RepID=A0AAN6P7W5_9PEZI|nr:RTC4-like domain-containing protein [Parachaetomium inaequale]